MGNINSKTRFEVESLEEGSEENNVACECDTEESCARSGSVKIVGSEDVVNRDSDVAVNCQLMGIPFKDANSVRGECKVEWESGREGGKQTLGGVLRHKVTLKDNCVVRSECGFERENVERGMENETHGVLGQQYIYDKGIIVGSECKCELESDEGKGAKDASRVIVHLFIFKDGNIVKSQCRIDRKSVRGKRADNNPSAGLLEHRLIFEKGNIVKRIYTFEGVNKDESKEHSEGRVVGHRFTLDEGNVVLSESEFVKKCPEEKNDFTRGKKRKREYFVRERSDGVSRETNKGSSNNRKGTFSTGCSTTNTVSKNLRNCMWLSRIIHIPKKWNFSI